MENVKWLLAGAGDIANSRVAAALTAAKDSILAAICDPVRERADALAARMGVKTVFYDYDRALAETSADAVYIATPHRLHVEMSLKALASGKHLLCEKPLGINAKECLKLLAEIRRSDCVSCCSNYRLFTNQFKMTREMIQRGEIGSLVGGWAHDEEKYYNPSHLKLLKENGMSPIHGYGFYLINLATVLFGMPEGVFARMSSFHCGERSDYDIDELENILLCFPGGGQFSILINNTADAPLRHSYEFQGSEGRIFWPECPPHFNTPIRKVSRREEREVPDSFSGKTRGELPNWHLPMIEEFIAAVQGGAPPVCTIESAVRTAVITEAAVRSAETGRMELITKEMMP